MLCELWNIIVNFYPQKSTITSTLRRIGEAVYKPVVWRLDYVALNCELDIISSKFQTFAYNYFIKDTIIIIICCIPCRFQMSRRWMGRSRSLLVLSSPVLTATLAHSLVCSFSAQ